MLENSQFLWRRQYFLDEIIVHLFRHNYGTLPSGNFCFGSAAGDLLVSGAGVWCRARAYPISSCTFP